MLPSMRARAPTRPVADEATSVTRQIAHARAFAERKGWMVDEAHVEVIREIRLSAAGHGMKAVAKKLNDRGAVSPRAHLGRSQTWAPSSIRQVLFRDLYRGLITWNRTRKRDRWGAHQQETRPEATGSTCRRRTWRS